MSPDLEKIAAEIYDDLGRGPGPDLNRIFAALKQLHDDTLEMAALVAEGNAPTFDHETAKAECRDWECGAASARLNAATAIRSLKSPDSGGAK